MKRVERTEVFDSSVDKIWGIMTDNLNYGWRSDLERIVVSDAGNQFTEYSKGGIQTNFTVQLKIPHERYEMDVENKNMTGHWTGLFAKENGRTRVTFIEEVEMRSSVLNFFAGFYLQKQQKRYILDLKKALGKD